MTTRPDGAFTFEKVAPGHYVIVARLPAGVFSNDFVEIVPGERNFAAVMLPKRRAGSTGFTVSAETLARRSNQRLQNQIRQANRILESGDFARAAHEYEKIAATAPDAGLYDGLALVYLQLGRRDQAYQAFEQALARDPQFLFAYSHLGAAYAGEGKYAELATLAARALEVDSRWAGAHLLLSEACVRTGLLDEAARHALTAGELMHGKSPDPHLLLARIRWSQQDCSAAREHLDRYLGLRSSARHAATLQPLMQAVQGCTISPSKASAW